ncbi:hypothetical protein R75461_01123 [Paraburkholderia nemoris]|uniref:hypothetical protein n=1 Tax=Paraburkholderia nemoris TaxID=2793076 RepID=UPI001B070D76|nr:hypothetical protein [Paraburkholderia nemoris]CAE6712516.1 hypothetical protein R75461_01123 [Paraburkholderia nemoris]
MDDDLLEQRFDLVDDRLEHHGERIDALEGARDQRHGRRLEWIVIALVALEAVFEVLMYFHPHA